MATFDQRNQKVSGNQYNAGEDINIGSVENLGSFVISLEQTLNEISRVIESGTLSKKLGKEVEGKVKKAIEQSKKTTPNRKAIERYLTEAKSLLQGISSAASLVTVLSQAVEAVKRLF